MRAAPGGLRRILRRLLGGGRRVPSAALTNGAQRNSYSNPTAAAAAAAGFGWLGIALRCLCHERALLGEPVALGVPPRLLGDGVRLLDLNAKHTARRGMTGEARVADRLDSRESPVR